MKRAFLIAVVMFMHYSLFANTAEPEYSGVSNHLFWFLQITDTHITTKGPWERNFKFAVGEGATVVHPAFIVNNGDVTDGSPGENIWCTDGPRVEEWEAYHQMLSDAGMEYGFYFDIAGNHDAYDDPGLANWTANSVVGQATGAPATYWTVNFSYGKYLFPDIMTSSNTGRPWAQDSDVKGFIIPEEATELERILTKHQDASVIFAQGHHGLYQTNGYEDLVKPLFEQFGVQYYLYGHAHDLNYRYQGDVAAWRTNTLGHGDKDNFSVFAIDNNVISMTAVDANDAWPLIVVTAPATAAFPKANGDMEPNHYAPAVPQCEDAPVRTLVFDSNFVDSVRFNIDSGEWIEMTQSNYEDSLWLGSFDATGYSSGEHDLSVETNGRTHTIPITISDDGCAIDAGSGDQPLEQPIVVAGDEEIPDTDTATDIDSEISDEDSINSTDSTPPVDEDTTTPVDDNAENDDISIVDDDTSSTTDESETSDENEHPKANDGGCSLTIL